METLANLMHSETEKLSKEVKIKLSENNIAMQMTFQSLHGQCPLTGFFATIFQVETTNKTNMIQIRVAKTQLARQIGS